MPYEVTQVRVRRTFGHLYCPFRTLFGALELPVVCRLGNLGSVGCKLRLLGRRKARPNLSDEISDDERRGLHIGHDEIVLELGAPEPLLMVADRLLPTDVDYRGLSMGRLEGVHQTQAAIGAQRDSLDAEPLGQQSRHLGLGNLRDF